jgi:hypothetical protein
MADIDNSTLGSDGRISDQVARDICAAIYDGLTKGTRSRNNIASQSAMSDRVRGSKTNDMALDSSAKSVSNPFKSRDPLGQFEEAFNRELMNAVVGGDFKQNLNNAMNTFSKEFGINLNQLPGEIGKRIAKDALSSGLGKAVTGSFQNMLIGSDGKGGILGKTLGKAGNKATQDAMGKVIGQLFSGASQMGGAADAAAAATQSLTATAGEAAALEGLIAPISAALPAIGVALVALAVAAEIAGPALEGLADLSKALGASAFKDDEMRAKRREAAEKRLTEDVNRMVEKPFEILTQAAQKWYDAWDQNLNTIAQTQGYDKESVYNLYASYAQRLRDENLGSVVSSTSIIDGLKQVLGTGLSGKAAEEFAYQATKLQSIIPNIDFFQYAASYAQIASNAMAQGASQADALKLANQQLESFANNVLYANRELAGGFNSGLSNTAQLFDDAVKIAQTARVGDTSAISGVLTSVSAVVGAVAPDLANGLVDNIVKAAIGGNSESIVALRSLAGINAGNTEFLRAFANDPKSVFSSVFNKLSELQTMSNDNFMEVAEGLAPIFGVDMAALARVDFSYLARAIDEMNTNSGSLQDNLDLLVSGQSTTTAEQAKMAEINEMILNDGLAVILDNEVARTMQEHLWDEQRTLALTSAEYGVNIQGSALHLLEGIAETVTTILRIMHPIDAANQMIDNIAESLDDTVVQREALQELLVNGAIKFNADSLSALTDYSGSGRLDLFNEGITESNASYLASTRLNRMLFGGTDVEASNYYRDMVDEAQAANAAAASSIQIDPYGHTLADTGEFLGDVWSAGFGLGGMMLDRATNPEESITVAGESIADRMYEAMTSPIYNGFEDTSRNNSDDIRSLYEWGTVGKSSARFLAAAKANAEYTKTVGEVLTDDTLSNKGKLKGMIESINTLNQTTADLNLKDTEGKLFTSLNDIVTKSNTISYDDWVKSQFGDRDSYLEAIQSYGTSEAIVKSRFEATQARAGAAVDEVRADAAFAFNQDARNALKEMRDYWGYNTSAKGVYRENIWQPYMDFWDIDNGNYRTQFWDPFYADNAKFDTRISEVLAEMINERDNWIGDPSADGTVRGLLSTLNDNLVEFNNDFNDWVTNWTDYYVNHILYTERTGQSAVWEDMIQAERAETQDSILAIANSLTELSNLEDLKDPTVQSNVLLAKIVVILESIMQQNNSTGGLSLIDSLSAMSLGITKRNQ